jgi:hypothetical protein
MFWIFKEKEKEKESKKTISTNFNTIPPNLNQLAIANGQKVLLNSIL